MASSRGKVRDVPENPSISANGRGDDLLDHAVDEVILLRVAAQIDERQHRSAPIGTPPIGNFCAVYRNSDGFHDLAGRGSQVRTRLSAGGSEIRTISPALSLMNKILQCAA